jgi:HlyD family secretion protein
MKKVITIFIILAVIAGGLFAYQQYNLQKQAEILDGLEAIIVERGILISSIGATGTVRSRQSATLAWQTSGEINHINIETGDLVSKDEVLASLKGSSLPASIIQAQADLINAQRALDNLLNSETQQAQARKNFADAQQALDDALNPELSQARALAANADAEKRVEVAGQALDILTAPPPKSAIEQAYANMLIAENIYNQTQENIERIATKAKVGSGDPMVPPKIKNELKAAFRKALEGLEMKLIQDQISLDDAVTKYDNLLGEVNPNDLSVAEADLATAQAQLDEAQREWERIKDGPSLAEISILEAKLADAQREWERIKDGPDPDDITVAEAQIAAAEARLSQARITAPFDGVITSVENKTGDLINPGTLAFQLDDLSQFFIDLDVTEIDINQIEIGQQVILTFDAILAKEYHGEVVEVASVGTEFQGVVNFVVTVELLDADADVKPGMTAEVDIKISQLDNVLLVPNRAVLVAAGEQVVYVLQRSPIEEANSLNSTSQRSNPMQGFRNMVSSQGDLANYLQPVSITLGASSANYSEVIAGELVAGDQIVLNPPTMLQQAAGFHNTSPIGGR